MQESLSAHINASPAVVLERLTDVAGLPEWNRAITDVVQQPAVLRPGSVWKVRLHALGQSWVSTSTLIELDEAQGRFRHRSQSDDGNPSYADWEWRVVPDAAAAKVTVTVALHPETFWRKYLLIHLRRPALRKEIRASLIALSTTTSRSGDATFGQITELPTQRADRHGARASDVTRRVFRFVTDIASARSPRWADASVEISATWSVATSRSDR